MRCNPRNSRPKGAHYRAYRPLLASSRVSSRLRKAQRGAAVTWIGCRLVAYPEYVEAAIAEDKVTELRDLTRQLLSENVLPLPRLRSYIGLASHFATLLFAWRPFLTELWAALHYDGGPKSSAPANCIWTKQVQPALHWIWAFLSQQRGSIVVRFRRDAFWNRGRELVISGDASPWGFGALLIVNGVVVEYYAAPLNEWLADFFHYPIGSHLGQQAWEALNLVLALRTWKAPTC